MFPYSYAADAFGRSYLLIAISFCETEAEDALLLFCQMTDDKLDDVCYAFIFILSFSASDGCSADATFIRNLVS